MSESPVDILVVDDEARGVEMMARALRRLGPVTTMTNSIEALRTTQRRHFGLVISDQRMPGVTGVELLSHLARNAPHTGRVLLTGFADLTATKSAINEANVHAYLSKPCPPDQLRTVAANVIARVRLSERNEDLLAQLHDRTEELEEVVASLRKEYIVREMRTRAAAFEEIARRVESSLAPLDRCLTSLDDPTAASSHKVQAAGLLLELRKYLAQFRAQ